MVRNSRQLGHPGNLMRAHGHPVGSGEQTQQPEQAVASDPAERLDRSASGGLGARCVTAESWAASHRLASSVSSARNSDSC